MTINFKASEEEFSIIEKIVERGREMLEERGAYIDVMDHIMDITACHLNGCPLDLQAFLNSQGLDFIHDFVGITDHINRRTGQLENCFLPRFAKR